MADTLNKAARSALTQARSQLEQGQIPVFLGVKGLLALMHQSIVDYFTQVGSEEDKIRSLAAFSIHALSLLYEDKEFDEAYGSLQDDESEDSDDVAEVDLERPIRTEPPEEILLDRRITTDGSEEDEESGEDAEEETTEEPAF